jgi:hypothetical protein
MAAIIFWSRPPGSIEVVVFCVKTPPSLIDTKVVEEYSDCVVIVSPED